MKKCLKSCVECPWLKNGPHSNKWKEYAKVMKPKYGLHACHMKSKDTWGIKEPVTNFCHGQREA